MDFRLLGPLEIRDRGSPVHIAAGKQRAVLAILLLNANSVVPRDRIVDDLWGDEVPESAQKMVQIYVSRLRKALPQPRLKTHAPGYLLEASDDELDLARFERSVAEGRGALSRGDAETAARQLREALALWRGPALAEFSEPFARHESARIEELQVAALEWRIEADLALGRHGDVVGELEALVGRHPLRERLRSQHMLALYRSGRHAEALDAYQEFRRMLDDELGIDPPAPLKDLERRMLRQDPSLDSPRTAAPARAATTAARPAPTPLAGIAGPPTGRVRELTHLERLLEEANGGTRRLVFVTGEAGIGKTTIVESLVAAASAAGHVAAHGQCVEHRGVGEPYLPVLEALSRLARQPRGERVSAVLARSAPSWLGQMPWLVPSDELEAIRLRLAGATHERMLRELLEALEAISSEETVVLVLEDLHWSDPSTIDLLDAIARRREPARLLVVGTYRREEAAARDHPVRQLEQALRVRGLCAEIAVGSLGEEALEEYLASRFEGASLPGLARLLRERTGGNPLFVRTLLGSWLERGLVDVDDGEVRGELDLLAADIPDGVRQLIDAMLRQLDADDGELLRAASVTGKEFSAAAVAACYGGAEHEEAVELRCEALARAGPFIERLGESSWPDGTVSARYAFSHDLHHEVLYQGLAPVRRARLHRQIGMRLEAAYGERRAEIAAALAWHFVRGRDTDRAVAALRLAAEQALRRSGHREALDHLTAALRELEQLPDSRERAERELLLRVTLGTALITAHGYAAPETRETYARARALSARLGDTPDRVLPVLYGLWNNELVAGKHAAAHELATAFLDIAERHDDPAVVVAHRAVAWPLLFLGRFGEARRHLDAVLAGYQPSRHGELLRLYGEDPAVAGGAALALCLWFLGLDAQACEASDAAVASARTLEHPLSLVYALFIRAKIAQLGDEPAAAGEAAESARSTAGEFGIAVWAAWATAIRGWATCSEGDVPGGLAAIREGLAGAAATGSVVMQPYLLGLLADAYARADRVDDGLRTLDDALALVEANDERYVEAELHRLRGELLLRRSQAGEGEAEVAFTRALEVARAQEARGLELRAALGAARLLFAQRRAAEARTLLSRALGGFGEELDTPALRRARGLLEQPEESRRRGQPAVEPRAE
jgi:DNA-binding SARP family transcriptional activator/predicted ATPase